MLRYFDEEPYNAADITVGILPFASVNTELFFGTTQKLRPRFLIYVAETEARLFMLISHLILFMLLYAKVIL